MTLKPQNAYLIGTNGEVSEIAPENGTDFQLDELKRFVEGYIEIVNLNTEQLLIVNEEGKFSKESNRIATEIAWRNGAIYPTDYICGNAVICPMNMVR